MQGVDVRVAEVTGRLCLDKGARSWCKLPYPGHPRGCPNYGKRDICPPQAPLIQDFIDLGEPTFFIIAGYDLEAHKNRMLSLHPDWSDRQARCCLYYQEGMRKELREAIVRLRCSMEIGCVDTLVPEAMGVHVFDTLGALGIPVEIRPQKRVLKVALVGKGK